MAPSSLKRKLSNPGHGLPSKQQEMTASVSPSTATSKDAGTCTFLQKFPAELRIAVYDHLVVAKEPLKGRVARKDTRYGLHLSIFRVNRQIYQEASDLFYTQNTFFVTSFRADEQKPTKSEGKAKAVPAGHLEPPLDLKHWARVRYLTVDLVYYPSNNEDANGDFPQQRPVGNDWKGAADPDALAYINNVVAVVSAASSSLRTFGLAAIIDESFCARKSLMSFFVCDRSRDFAHALAALAPAVTSMPIRFEFPDCYFHIDVDPALFVSKSILLLACQVMFCQSQVRVDRLLVQFENGEVGEESTGAVVRTDLTPYVGSTWSRKRF
ncbi:hypothetical protein EJ04DRAFT_507549 [Polyplosphaeria fusca]|uniref:Uncharacterized protein n=1 Tax=Polyplosphaeria fusca TaxID=682080 RepID=A0A9P4RD34_9PLEO|nr:hypothetical protein EJ04DRAFT_507549 [Polyplosphaeria fusca]